MCKINACEDKEILDNKMGILKELARNQGSITGLCGNIENNQ